MVARMDTIVAKTDDRQPCHGLWILKQDYRY